VSAAGHARLLLLLAVGLALVVGPPPALAQSEEQPESTAGTNDEASNEPATAVEEPDAELTPRGRYNRGVELYRDGDREGSAEAFLAARDEAGPDPELRYRAAFNLGISLAAQADERQAENPEQAIELLRQSSAWFHDAIRLAAESDDDARINLELVLRRIQRLADQLNRGKKLEARLDRAIDDQRGLRDRVRRLLQSVEAEGVAAEPLAFQREFEELATLERMLQAEAGSIADLAAEERALIEGKPEEQRSDEERIRLVQLQNLDYYMQQARQSLSDSRRRLRRLEGERAHRRADAALAELKRAREQLLDPVTVLQSVAQDEAELLDHTAALEALESGGIRLDDERSVEPPPWLNTEHLEERQQTLSLRTDEVLARLRAGVESADDAAAAEPGRSASPDQQRMLSAAGEAIPHLHEASAAMGNALVEIPAGRLRDAAQQQARAMRALMRAIERFAGVRELIELAYGDQAGVVGLLTPPGKDDEDSPVAALSTEDRMRLVREAVDNNRERLERLDGLLQDELQQAEAQAAQGQDPNAPAAGSSEIDALRQKYERAGQLREQAALQIEELDGRLTAIEAGRRASDPLDPAHKALADLEQLRRLFFNLIEHLKQLLRDQAETHDATATLQFEADAEGLDLGMGPAAERQQGHAAIADSLARAIDRQADEAAASTEPQAQQAVETLSEVAGEVHGAAARMDDAGFLLDEAVEQYAALSSPDLEPVLEHQLAAIEHLENAIRLLQPPQQPQDEQQDQKQQQQQPQPQPEEDEMSQRQALRRLQAIRDREAERKRRREHQAAQPEPVEKDW